MKIVDRVRRKIVPLRVRQLLSRLSSYEEDPMTDNAIAEAQRIARERREEKAILEARVRTMIATRNRNG